MNALTSINSTRGKKGKREFTIYEEEESTFKSSLAWCIILSLRFFNCEPSEIFRVLQSYEMGGTVSEVALYISDDELPNYHSFEFEDGVFELDFAGKLNFAEITCKVEFANQMPVRSVLSHDGVANLTPREIVGATTLDGQTIITTVKDGEVRCCSQGLNPPSTLP